jgi:hypothetical protein
VIGNAGSNADVLVVSGDEALNMCNSIQSIQIDASSGPSLSYDEARRIAANIDVGSAMRRNSDVRFRAAIGPTRLMSVSAALNN